MTKECIFCKIIQGDVPCDKIYEDEHILSFLDQHPVSPGHSLIISKKHYETFLDIPNDLLCEIIKAVKKVGKAVMKATNAEGFNLHVNTGKVAGQFVFHVHFHIIPRFEGDKIDYICPPIKYKPGQKQEIMDKIKKVLK
jgi:histidine triad (HIT) family protein